MAGTSWPLVGELVEEVGTGKSLEAAVAQVLGVPQAEDDRLRSQLCNAAAKVLGKLCN